MLLSEALVQLKERVAVYRTGWDPQDGYVVLMPGMTHIWKIVLQPAPNAGNYIFSLADLEADDWAVYPEVKPAIELQVEEKAAVAA